MFVSLSTIYFSVKPQVMFLYALIFRASIILQWMKSGKTPRPSLQHATIILQLNIQRYQQRKNEKKNYIYFQTESHLTQLTTVQEVDSLSKWVITSYSSGVYKQNPPFPTHAFCVFSYSSNHEELWIKLLLNRHIYFMHCWRWVYQAQKWKFLQDFFLKHQLL